jgi:exodeoxyribonuclease-1
MNFIVFDFETTGRSARFDQILQAGFIVYDSNFEEIDRLNIKSRLNPDIVPSIHALRVNRLTMSQVLSEDLTTYQMALSIEKFLSKYENCFFIGFNSINFDEEFLRQLLWEHFFFPYKSNTKGNTRGDVLNFVTMAHAFDKDCVNVPRNDEGKLSFKLEGLAKANNFDTSNSHEAIADVEVTMQLMFLLKNKRSDLFKIFFNNSSSRNVEENIFHNDLFTLHNYLFNNHKIYLVKKLIKHPSYKNQFIGFDMKYDVEEIVKLTELELREEYKKKSFFRKIKLNKQPSILDKSYALKFKPYSNLSDDEIDHKCRLLDDKNFLRNLENILQKESLEYLDNQSQEVQLEESTIYSQNLNYNDSLLMKNFHSQPWDIKWNFAEKFKDPRLRFFAAKHIFRNFPETLPKKVFLHLHKKVSERIFSLEKKNFLTLPGAMEEADTISLEIEEKSDNKTLLTQLNQYNIYIDFLNDYYKQLNPKPIKFDSNLSKKLFG